MATFHDRRLAPKFQAGLLGRAFAHPSAFMGQPVGNPDTLASRNPLADPDSTAAQPNTASGLAHEEALASTALVALLEPAEAAEARAFQSRRRLGEALEYGFALLDALDLPPLALDVIDDAIAALDALEAPDEDLEPYLAGYYDAAFYLVDLENDDEDDEDHDPAEETSLETAGRGFVRCGADDVEEDDPAEENDHREPDDECGSEDGEDIGHHASQFTPRPLTHAERAEVAAIAGRAATMRRASHV